MASPLSSAGAALRTSPEAARHAQGLSLRNFVAAIVTSASIFVIEVCLFLLLKDRLKQVYQPRTYVVPEEQRIKNCPSGSISWILRTIQTPDRIVLQYSGLDAFFFLRYLRTLFAIFVSLSVGVVPSLVPLNFWSGTDATGLDRFSWINIAPDQTRRYWVHLVTALAVVVFLCYIIYVEMDFYVQVRNCYLTSPEHRLSDAANTILVTDIPEKYLSVLEDLYGIFPGGVRSIRVNRDVSTLLKKLQYRRKLVSKLETAETKLIRSAVISFRQRKGHELTPLSNKEPLWKRYLAEKDRDRTYLPILGCTWMPAIPIIGKRVDTIHYCLKELARLNEEIEAGQRELIDLKSHPKRSSNYPPTNSAFIHFNSQTAAYMACQTIMTSDSLRLLARLVDVPAQEIRWSNLSQQWWNRYIRSGLVWIAIALLLVLWTVPVALTGFLSQITTLADSVSWLAWIANAPTWLSGIIQGVLPQLMLTILTALIPQILLIFIGWQGLLTETEVELWLQNYYFIFLFLQNFLTVSLSSSITAIAQDLLGGLNSTPALLARNLPLASNYFFSYLILQGLSVSAGALLQASGLIRWLILAPWANHTPRQKWKKQTSLPAVRWGTFYPLYANLACIGLTYAIIAPLILIFGAIAFGLFWFVSRYNILYVFAYTNDTKGQLYPAALKQLFTGIYMMELCLIGLFLSVRDDQGAFTSIGQAVIMMIATMSTVVYQLIIGDAFASVLKYVPASQDNRRSQEGESTPERSATGKLGPLQGAVHACYGWMMPSKKVSEEVKESISEFAQNQLIAHNHFRYENEAAHCRSPVIWIPKDALGISADEIAYAKTLVQDVRISDRLAEVDMKGQTKIVQNVSCVDLMGV